MQYRQQIHDYLTAHKAEMLALLGDLIAVRSVQGDPAPGMPFGTEPARALALMLEACRAYGFSTENVDNYAGSADLNALEPALGVLAHLDVVPEGEGWEHDPYRMTYDEASGRLIGRGTSDDKGPAVAALFAMRAVKELGIPMRSGVRLILGTNEENGSEDLAYYTAHRTLPPMVLTPDGDYPVITLEKGMARLRLTAAFTDGRSRITELTAGDVINAVPATASAAVRTTEDALRPVIRRVLGRIGAGDAEVTAMQCGDVVRLTVEGVSAHASTPEKGCNALTLLLAILAEAGFDGEQGETVRQLAALYPFGETDGKACGIAASDALSGALTLVCSVMRMDAQGMTAYNDIRFPVCCTGAQVTEGMRRALAPIGCEVLLCDEPHHTDEGSAFVQTLLRVYEEVTGLPGECLAIGGGTYVHHIEGGVAFGCTFPGVDVHMHGAEEFIQLDHLLLDAEMLALAMTELCGGAA